MLDALAGLLGSFFGVLILIVLITWPCLLLYFVWRVTRDLRRIADALETRNVSEPRAVRAPAAPAASAVAPREPGVTVSAFGR
jgi:hypothetical protein